MDFPTLVQLVAGVLILLLMYIPYHLYGRVHHRWNTWLVLIVLVGTGFGYSQLHAAVVSWGVQIASRGQ